MSASPALGHARRGYSDFANDQLRERRGGRELRGDLGRSCIFNEAIYSRDCHRLCSPPVRSDHRSAGRLRMGRAKARSARPGARFDRPR